MSNEGFVEYTPEGRPPRSWDFFLTIFLLLAAPPAGTAQPAGNGGPGRGGGMGMGMGQGRGLTPGATGAAPRQGTVRVADARGALEERQVELGVSNRVQAQVLSGLAEGERVVSGLVVGNGAGGPQMTPRL